jgi:DNA polymerase-3 subunit beta
MKFVIATAELNYLINKCQAVVPQKPTVPVIANFLVEAFNQELVITATDMGMAIRCCTEAKILEEGATTLPARTFSALIRELTAINVEISTNENHITEVRADSSRFKLHGMDRNGFPHLPDLVGAPSVNFSQKDLKEAIYRTSFSVAKEDRRHEFMGLSLVMQNGRATFVGTDGKKLSRTFISLPVETDFAANMIIPLKTVEELQKNLEEEGEVRVFFLGEKIAFQTPNTLLISKLVSGEYPDVSEVIPEKVFNHVLLHREELMTLLRQVSLFRTDTAQSACFSFDQGQLTLFANTMAVGEGKVGMPVDWRGPRMDIAFNPTVFYEVLRHCKNEVVSLGLVDPHNPGIVNDTKEPSEPSPDSNPLFLMMPMRLMNEAQAD